VDVQDFLFLQTLLPALGPIQPRFPRVTRLFPGGKRQGREVNHSPPSSGEVDEGIFLILFRTVKR
jgi:hypothetical protein